MRSLIILLIILSMIAIPVSACTTLTNGTLTYINETTVLCTEYYEYVMLIVNNTSVTLDGNGTVMNGLYGNETAIQIGNYSLGFNNTTTMNFTLHSYAQGINIDTNSSVVENIDIYNITDNGITLFYGNNSTVQNCTIRDSESTYIEAITNDAYYSTIVNNTIRNMSSLNGATGIVEMRQPYGNLTNNTIQDINGTCSVYSYWFDSNSIISSNTIKNGKTGIYVYINGSYIVDNNIENMSQYGIHIEDTSGVIISGNNITDTDIWDLYLSPDSTVVSVLSRFFDLNMSFEGDDIAMNNVTDVPFSPSDYNIIAIANVSNTTTDSSINITYWYYDESLSGNEYETRVGIFNTSDSTWYYPAFYLDIDNDYVYGNFTEFGIYAVVTLPRGGSNGGGGGGDIPDETNETNVTNETQGKGGGGFIEAIKKLIQNTFDFEPTWCAEGWYWEPKTQRCLPEKPLYTDIEKRLLEPIFWKINSLHLLLLFLLLLPFMEEDKKKRRKYIRYS